MSISSEPEHLFDAVKSRHRSLRLAGAISTITGLLLAIYVVYRWLFQGVTHEVLSLAAAVAILFGVQLLVFSALTSMLIALHREVIQHSGGPPPD